MGTRQNREHRQGRRNQNTTATEANRRPGYAFLHKAVDDQSRLAYTEILSDKKKETAAGFWEHANAYFESCGGAAEPGEAQAFTSHPRSQVP